MSSEASGGAGSLRRQLVGLSAAVTAVAAVLLTLLVQLLLGQTSTDSVNQVLRDRCDNVATAVRGASTGSTIVVPASALQAGVAVYDDAGALVGGAVPSAFADVYDELSRTTEPTVTREIDDSDRVRAQPFTLASGVRGVVVVTERLAPYEEAERYALAVSIGTGLLAVLASALLAAWVSRRALRPVGRMAATASQWSERDLGRRFDLGAPTNEITALGGTLDGLLDKVSAAIRSEQRLTSELAHELRTPLTAVQGTAGLMLMRPDLDDDLRDDVEEILVGTRRMGETITGLLELARSTSSMAAVSVSHLRSAVEHVTERHADVAIGDVDATIGMPESLVVRAIGPVVDNAVRIADHVTITVGHARPGYVAVLVDDDGPGVGPDDVERIFEAGHTSGGHAGSGLGLPLARRIARSAGGDVRLERRDVGSRFVIELPRA
ncbi:sensor histidine kinase [Nocardioides currus]|uniref:sensor histidine kinase n=1 Tax=Nocardioides currus TaxID=2133958 RepID=UPI001403A3D6|nr:HAMP domain-containing sensor histidine kinase [Nocardioides currus]